MESIVWRQIGSKQLMSALRKTNVLFSGGERIPIASTASHLSTVRVDQNGSKSHNHSMLWSLERYLSLGLLAVIPLSFAVSTPALDYLLALSLVTHVHWGIEAIVVDYIRPAVFGKVIPKLALIYVYILSMLALSGLFYFNYTDVGLTNAIRMIAKM